MTASNVAIRAQVIDIRTCKLSESDHLLVDTNAWYWTTYDRASVGPKAPKRYQVEEYPKFLKSALDVNARLAWSPVNYFELSRLIESTEYEIAQLSQDNVPNIKEWRHSNGKARVRVKSAINVAWSQVTGTASTIGNFSISETEFQQLLEEFRQYGIYGNDVMTVHAYRKSNATGIVSDDFDFCMVPDVKLFTANATTLAAARNHARSRTVSSSTADT